MRKTIIAALLSAGVVASAHAEGVYGGLKYINADADVSGLDSASNAGVLLGYEFGKDNLRFAVEGEFTKTVSDGDGSISGTPVSWDVDTMAIYGVARYGKEFYAKAKVGFLREEVSVSAANVSIEGDDSGPSFGLGVGYRASDNFAIEAEYTVVEEDINFISIGLNVYF